MLGPLDGRVDGSSLDRPVGTVLVIPDGGTVGVRDGIALGELPVGACEGRVDGVLLGLTVGSGDGNAVGSVVGATVQLLHVQVHIDLQDASSQNPLSH